MADARPKVDQLYKQYCMACHGEDFRGGLASSLVDGQWEFGGSAQEIFTSIKDGHPDQGMVGFGGSLSDEQIQALVIYLREQEQKANRPKPPAASGGTTRTQYHDYRVEDVVADGLRIPWAMVQLPDGRMLITEREDRLRIVDKNGKLRKEPVRGLPEMQHHRQGGLMEIALHPDYDENGWIYIAYSHEAEAGGEYFTVIARGRLEGNRWVDNETIFQVPEEFYNSSGVHFGIRFVFHPDGYLYFSIGDRGRQNQAQDLSRPNGKTHRIHPDGRVPADNPFRDNPEAYPTIWTTGNRNAQGLDHHPVTGDIWETEHGPRGGDELNLIRPGLNYGWPVISYGMNYNGTPLTDKTHAPGMEQPVDYWTPSIAVCGIDFYEGDHFPQWEHDLFIGGLASKELWRYRLDGDTVAEKELVAKNLGRIRDVHSAADGHLYLVLNGPDKIVRLVPAD